MKFLLLALAAFSVSASADTIFHCKDYGGGTFWANTTCSNHKALIDRIASVPGGMTFNQQVQIAEGQRSAANNQVAVEAAQSTVATKCGALKFERDKIWSRYSNWQYQKPEVVGPDRQRTLAIEAEQQTMRCPNQ
jgi:hypothetical protein